MERRLGDGCRYCPGGRRIWPLPGWCAAVFLNAIPSWHQPTLEVTLSSCELSLVPYLRTHFVPATFVHTPMNLCTHARACVPAWTHAQEALILHAHALTHFPKHQVLARTLFHYLSSRKCSHFAVGGMKASNQGSSRCIHLPLPAQRSDTTRHTPRAHTHAAPTRSMCRVADRRQRAASAGSSACAVRSSLARIALSVSSTTTDKDSCAYLVWRAQHKGANGSSLASSLSLISYYYSHTMKLRSQCLT